MSAIDLIDEDDFKKLSESINEIDKFTNEVKAEDNSTINSETIIDQDLNLNAFQTVNRVKSVIKIYENLKKSKLSRLIPKTYLTDLKQSFSDLLQSTQLFLNTIKQRDPHKILSLSGNNIELSYDNGEKINLKEMYTNILIHCDNFLFDILNLQKMTESKGFFDFSDIMDAILKDNKDISEEKSKAQNLTGKIEKIYENLSSLQNIAKTQAEGIASGYNTFNELKGDLDRAHEYALAKKEEITGIMNDYENIKNDSKTYSTEITSFKNQIQTRIESYDVAKRNLDISIQKIEKSKNLIEERITESEALLKGATNSALGSQIKLRLDILEKKLTNSYYMAMGSYVALIILAAFFAYTIIYDPSQGNEFYRNIIIRSLFIIPAVFLVQFCNKRYYDLFLLQEHYAYKYSIATSVEGFKKQATGYENEVALFAFYELGFNPATDANNNNKQIFSIREFINRIIRNKASRLSNKVDDEINPIEPKLSDSN